MQVYLGWSDLLLTIPVISELTCGLSPILSHLYSHKVLILQICDYTLTYTENPAQILITQPKNLEPILKNIKMDQLSVYHTS